MSNLKMRNLKWQDSKKFTRQRGYGLLEISIGILVVGLALAAVAAGVTKMLANQRVNGEVALVQEVSTAIQKNYHQRSSFTGISTAVEAQKGVFPETMVDKASWTVANRWGGAYTVASAAGGTRFTLTATSVKDYECRSIIPQLDGVTYTVSVGGTTVKAANATTDDALLTANCNGGANTIVYEFTK